MIEKILLGVIVGVLKAFMDRHAQTNAAKAEVYRELWANAKRAYEWESAAATQSDAGATLRVREQGGRVKLQSDDADPSGGTTPP